MCNEDTLRLLKFFGICNQNSNIAFVLCIPNIKLPVDRKSNISGSFHILIHLAVHVCDLLLGFDSQQGHRYFSLHPYLDRV